MKNLFLFFLISSYLIGGLGLRANQHFCCGELVDFKIISKISNDLLEEAEQAEDEGEGCCSQRVITFKVDDGQSQPKGSLPKFSLSSFFLVEGRFLEEVSTFCFYFWPVPLIKVPPDLCLKPIFLLFSCFRI